MGELEFDPAAGTITVVDDGLGMSMSDIRDKWLFVAYSEKALPSGDYRDRIRPAGQFAGSKGIGRFACDTLGGSLELYSRSSASNAISLLEIDWIDFEGDSTDEFQDVEVSLGRAQSFPSLANPSPPAGTGTVLLIKDARHRWDADAIRRLRRDLAKLVDPFGTTSDVTVSTWLADGGLEMIEGADGPVGNEIAELLRDKTSHIEVLIEGGTIETTLHDRGRMIYSVREPSPYRELERSRVSGQVFFLNRSAKHTFTVRMGVRPIEFGSVFLFLNGFRILPIGDEVDDTFSLNRRKQQGQSRYLGTRDIIGRVDVTAPPKMFREVSSRDAGLVDDANWRALYEAIRRQMVFRLERYVVGVNWADKPDQSRDTPEGLETDSARERILAIMGGLARTRDVDILYFDEDLVRVPDDPDRVTDAAIRSISEVAESSGDARLLSQVEEARRRIDQPGAHGGGGMREQLRGELLHLRPREPVDALVPEQPDDVPPDDGGLGRVVRLALRDAALQVALDVVGEHEVGLGGLLGGGFHALEHRIDPRAALRRQLGGQRAGLLRRDLAHVAEQRAADGAVGVARHPVLVDEGHAALGRLVASEAGDGGVPHHLLRLRAVRELGNVLAADLVTHSGFSFSGSQEMGVRRKSSTHVGQRQTIPFEYPTSARLLWRALDPLLVSTCPRLRPMLTVGLNDGVP